MYLPTCARGAKAGLLSMAFGVSCFAESHEERGPGPSDAAQDAHLGSPSDGGRSSVMDARTGSGRRDGGPGDAGDSDAGRARDARVALPDVGPRGEAGTAVPCVRSASPALTEIDTPFVGIPASEGPGLAGVASADGTDAIVIAATSNGTVLWRVDGAYRVERINTVRGIASTAFGAAPWGELVLAGAGDESIVLTGTDLAGVRRWATEIDCLPDCEAILSVTAPVWSGSEWVIGWWGFRASGAYRFSAIGDVIGAPIRLPRARSLAVGRLSEGLVAVSGFDRDSETATVVLVGPEGERARSAFRSAESGEHEAAAPIEAAGSPWVIVGSNWLSGLEVQWLEGTTVTRTSVRGAEWAFFDADVTAMPPGLGVPGAVAVWSSGSGRLEVFDVETEVGFDLPIYHRGVGAAALHCSVVVVAERGTAVGERSLRLFRYDP